MSENDNSSADSSAPEAESSPLAAELEKTKKDFMYLAAEFENYKRHSIKERSDLIRYGAERFIRELLDVTDNFERALGLDLNQDNVDSFKEGISMIHREIQALLSKHGVAEIPSEGLAFDPSIHEALTSEVTAEIKPGHISRVFRKAFKLHDRLLRPAQVVVAQAPSAPSNNNES